MFHPSTHSGQTKQIRDRSFILCRGCVYVQSQGFRVTVTLGLWSLNASGVWDEPDWEIALKEQCTREFGGLETTCLLMLVK